MFLQDKRFLEKLDKLHIKEQFIKITVLNWQEEPLQTIQGIAINGSVNLDGNSSMRRTASLSVFAEEKDNDLANIDHLFSVNKKCKLELGIVNTLEKQYIQQKDKQDNIKNYIIDYQEMYGQIVWFPLGIYIMFNPSIAHSMTGVTVSMNLKDKMCLLNGDLGGQIHSSVDFAYQDELVDADSASLEKNPVLIYNIIKQLVNHWGNESLNKIIISQVPLQIRQTVKWNGSTSVYLVKDLNSPMLCTTKQQALDWKEKQASKASIQEYQPGYDVGFKYTAFTYPGELVCNAGETVTSILDKIIGIIGNYEYFYDVEGNFRFQQKQNYFNMTNTAYWSKEQDQKVQKLPSQIYEADFYRLSKPVYSFVHNEYTTAYNNTLNYNNLKNDFVVWGSRPVTSGSSERIPCRFHLAIDKKPQLNKHSIALYKDSFETIRAIGLNYNEETGKIFPTVKENETDVFPEAIEENAKGRIFKIIINRQSVDWREEIYYQMLEDQIIGTGEDTEKNNTYFQYYAELKEEFPKIFNLLTQNYIDEIFNEIIIDGVKQSGHPDQINYFLDFIDEDSELGQYSVNNIGRRAKIIADNNEGINCVFEPAIPDIVYLQAGDENNIDINNRLTAYGQYWTQIPKELSELLVTGGKLNSCFEKIKDLLYQYTHLNNTISITSLPIYYLEPNTRITVEDGPAGIYGDYIIQSISLPLDISSTMTINAYKALQKI